MSARWRMVVMAVSAAFYTSHAAATPATNDAVTVVGTRVVSQSIDASLAPVSIVTSDALSQAGQSDLGTALAQQISSFNAEPFGGDLSELSLSARLDGISPNDTLVLVNGKRRHITADFHAVGGAYQGAEATDLSLIPLAAIDHVEVLKDGAAAQYGSDAIAGVINIILKNSSTSQSASATAGQYYAGDGDSYDFALNKGLALGQRGFINLTYEKRFHDHSQRGNGDSRIVNADGTPIATVYDARLIPGYPDVNRVFGDALYTLSNYAYNASLDLNGTLHLYSFGTISTRRAKAYENWRAPDLIVASPVFGTPGNYDDPNSIIFSKIGFSPLEAIGETDYQFNLGAKGSAAGWNWDLSGSYGRDEDAIETLHSANRSLFIDTHATPTYFYDGAFVASEWTASLGIHREFDLGLPSPLTLFLGSETRDDSYRIMNGDTASIYKEGAQAFPGFLPSDAGIHRRTSYAAYFDIAAHATKALRFDLAARYESYSDVGNTTVGKISARYDVSPALAIRGSASTGFRAPTLAEEYYSATNVTPTTAFAQLPANSSAAAVVGIAPLRAERSTNLSVGIVVRPANTVAFTLNAYSISLRNRIVGTGSLYGSANGNVVAPAVNAAIRLHGNQLDPAVAYTGINLFTNGVETMTEGLDLDGSYKMALGRYGSVTWVANVNLNETHIRKIVETPSQLAPQTLLTKTALSLLTDSAPKAKIILQADWRIGRCRLEMQESIFGPTSVLMSPDGANYYRDEVGTSALTDLQISYRLTRRLTATLGGDNILDVRPPTYLLTPQRQSSAGVSVWGAPNTISPYGIDGGYYYGRIAIGF